MDLPDFSDPRKTYFLFGSTLKAIIAHLRENRPCGTVGKGVLVAYINQDGSFVKTDSQGGGGGYADNLPDPQTLDDDLSYLLRPETKRLIFETVRKNKTKAIVNGGLKIAKETQDGTWVAVQ